MMEVVCGVIRDGEGRYLACRRPVGKHLGGLWEFPGGKVEAGERAEEALVRELREELEVAVEVLGRLADVCWRYDRGEIRLMPFLCRILSGEVSAVEHEELGWFFPEEFAALEWAPADVPILREITGGGREAPAV